MVGNLLYSESTQLNVNIADPHGGPQGTKAGGGSGGGRPHHHPHRPQFPGPRQESWGCGAGRSLP